VRRLILEEPVSAAALWSRRLAVFSIALILIAVGLVRLRAVDLAAGMSVFAFAILSACAALLLAGTAAVVIWRTGRRGTGVALAGALLALGVLAWPIYLSAKAIRLPLLNDVATDINEPPYFSRSSQALAARGGHVPSEIEPDRRLPQARAYPRVQPIVLDLEADEAFQLALKAAGAMGWEVVSQVRPGGRRGEGDGRIDAVARTALLRFPDDVVVRVRPLAGQTRIDVRSASRYGRHDFGVNAARIEAFALALQAQLDAR
jgi:uncharacterized protein (DUF1499 family)